VLVINNEIVPSKRVPANLHIADELYLIAQMAGG
jgi:hypothetical protein